MLEVTTGWSTLDLWAFFDTVPWDRVVATVAVHTVAAWVLLYVKRWLVAPLQPDVVFERYADDVVVHCASHARAVQVLAGITERMNGLSLAPNAAKTQIVYCQDNNRRQRFPLVAFTFLGNTFRPRAARARRGATVCAFLPAISPHALKRISPHALKRISAQVRRWRLHRRIFNTLSELARTINPIVAGWMQYYGPYYPSALYPLLARINAYPVRWIRNTYRRYDRTRAARRKLRDLATAYPHGFRHSQWVTTAW